MVIANKFVEDLKMVYLDSDSFGSVNVVFRRLMIPVLILLRLIMN